jgi:hypothetical protein
VIIFFMERSFFFVAFQHDHVRDLMPFEKGRSTSSASGRLGLIGIIGSQSKPAEPGIRLSRFSQKTCSRRGFAEISAFY